MKNLMMCCMSMETNHLEAIKGFNYLPVGLGEKIFSEDGNYLINHSSSVMLLENGKYLDRINHHATYKDMFKAINKYLR